MAAQRSALQSASTEDARKQLAARLARRLSRSNEGLTEVVRPDGRRSFRVNGGFGQAQLARVDESGKVVTECVDNLPAAERMLRGEEP